MGVYHRCVPALPGDAQTRHDLGVERGWGSSALWCSPHLRTEGKSVSMAPSP